MEEPELTVYLFVDPDGGKDHVAPYTATIQRLPSGRIITTLPTADGAQVQHVIDPDDMPAAMTFLQQLLDATYVVPVSPPE